MLGHQTVLFCENAWKIQTVNPNANKYIIVLELVDIKRVVSLDMQLPGRSTDCLGSQHPWQTGKPQPAKPSSITLWPFRWLVAHVIQGEIESTKVERFQSRLHQVGVNCLLRGAGPGEIPWSQWRLHSERCSLWWDNPSTSSNGSMGDKVNCVFRLFSCWF